MFVKHKRPGIRLLLIRIFKKSINKNSRFTNRVYDSFGSLFFVDFFSNIDDTGENSVDDKRLDYKQNEPHHPSFILCKKVIR